MLRAILVSSCLAALLLTAGTARAEKSVQVRGQIGGGLFLQSRSKAIGHIVKPTLGIEGLWAWKGRIDVGAHLLGVIDGSEHYRVLGGLAVARYRATHGPRFLLAGSAGLGLGYDADILHGDLQADWPLLPYGRLAIETSWRVGDNLHLGVEAGWLNLSVITLGALVGHSF